MSKIMLVNVTHVEESRVAILDEGILAAYEIETLNRTHIKGNIHNAVVESVHPSLEAAFLRIGPDLKGFLPLDEVNFKLLPSRSDSRKMGRIGQHLHQGQKLMAQVVREPFAGKPPTVSTYFSLPGRYLVLMPGVDSSGVSRKIESASQRERLKKIVDELSPPEGFGVIVRTAGLDQTKTELQRDLRYLLRLWQSIQRASGDGEFPSLVYREADLVIRTIRDHLTPDIGEVWIDSEETYERARAFVGDVMPTRAKMLKLYTGDRPLFNRYNLEEQIERIYKRRVPLPSGGEIVIDGTEALTAIDVNSARSKRSAELEDISLQTNSEAAMEITRQLRLRDLGGLVVIDFIDMAKISNKKKVEKVMRDAMRGDRAKHDITTISKLGLMEIARQRLKGAKMAASYATCPHCDGYGLIKNVETAALAVVRKLQTRCSRGDAGRIRVQLPPEVATWLLNHKREELVRMERRHRLVLEIEPKRELLRHESEFVVHPRDKTEDATPAGVLSISAMGPAPVEPGPTAGEPPAATVRPEPTVEDRDGAESPAPRKRRRRRRSAAAGDDRAAATASHPAPEAGDAANAGDVAEADDEAAAAPSEPAEAVGPAKPPGPAPDVEPAHEADESREEPHVKHADDAGPGEAERPGGEAAETTRERSDEEASGRPRRRRRGRRRGRGQGAAAAGADGAPDKPRDEKPDKPRDGKPDKPRDEKPDKPRDGKPDKPRDGKPDKPPAGKPKRSPAGDTEVEVPRHIRADELMPAASGGRKGKRRSPDAERRRR